MEYLWNSSDKATIDTIRSTFTNCIGPVQGRAAQPATEEAPAMPAIGEPTRWYVNINSAVPLERPVGVDETDEATSLALLGRWA